MITFLRRYPKAIVSTALLTHFAAALHALWRSPDIWPYLVIFSILVICLTILQSQSSRILPVIVQISLLLQCVVGSAKIHGPLAVMLIADPRIFTGELCTLVSLLLVVVGTSWYGNARRHHYRFATTCSVLITTGYLSGVAYPRHWMPISSGLACLYLIHFATEKSDEPANAVATREPQGDENSMTPYRTPKTR